MEKEIRVGMELILGSEIYMSMEGQYTICESDEDKLKIPYSRIFSK